jgi:serine/threonine protein kinase
MAGDGSDLDQNTVALTSGGKTSRLLKTGDIIGDSYRLKGLIGRGGMGYVFRAEHIIIGQDYALKMLAPDQINEVTWNRFQSEGKAIARLDHPNIVKIYNMGVDQGDYPYYVMDLLDGVALSECINDKLNLSVDEILDMFIQLASGFGYAHSRGIIHRDVKPSNVVLIGSGGQYPTAKIVDFGIAKLVGANDWHNQSLTTTGEIFGSPYYMSPEQCLATEIDHRADIYSLGCTLFEALCGRPPFMGESAVQTVMMHQNKPSPTLESVSGRYSSDEMEALVAKMLMKRPADRYQSMEQVRHDLERIKERKSVVKNVETGFKSSMDSQLESMGSRYEEEKKQRAKRKKILIVCASTVVGFGLVVSVGVALLAARPTTRTPRQDFANTIPSHEEIDASHKQPDSRLDAVGKKLEAVKSITSTIDKASGSRVFHCPDVDLGSFCWWKEETNAGGITARAHKDGSVRAYGETRVPAGQSLFLVIDQAINNEAFLHPSFLAKFGPSELSGLCLYSEAPIGDLSTDSEEKLLNDQTIKLIENISGWTNCQYFSFYHMPAPDQALIELDKHKELKRFVARGANINADFLAKRRFFGNLTSLELSDLPDVDAVFSSLKGSSAIQRILVFNTTASASSIASLAGCPNLKILEFDRCPVDNAALEAMATIKGLNILSLFECKLKQSQMSYLAKLKNAKHIELDLTGWPKPARLELLKRLPNGGPMGRMLPEGE